MTNVLMIGKTSPWPIRSTKTTNIRVSLAIVAIGPLPDVGDDIREKRISLGQGDTYEEALADVQSAIRFHIETFGEETLHLDPPVIDAYLAETQLETVQWASSP